MNDSTNYIQVLNVVASAISCVYLLKKIIDMQRFHVLRVVFLTILIFCLVVFLFAALGDFDNSDCPEELGAYCETEV